MDRYKPPENCQGKLISSGHDPLSLPVFSLLFTINPILDCIRPGFFSTRGGIFLFLII